MESTPIIGSGNNIPLPLQKTSGSEIAEASGTFKDILVSTISMVNKADISGDKAITQLHTSDAKNLHEVMLAVEEADIAIRMLVQMRNKAQEAYNEIMRLQI